MQEVRIIRNDTTITFEGFVKYARTLFANLFLFIFVIIVPVAAGEPRRTEPSVVNYFEAHHWAILV